ncbi:hypothetical protein ACQEU3_43675 [Spirillospora sp. CA-253888]
MKGIFSRARSLAHGFLTDHPDATPLTASVIRCGTMLCAGTLGAGDPTVLAACATVNLATDYAALLLSRPRRAEEGS